MSMTFKVIFFSIGLLNVSITRAEDDSKAKWMNEAWLTEPKLAESRPDWWFDVWNGEGAIVIAKVEAAPEKLHDYVWHEILVIGSESDPIKIKLQSIKINIEKILSVSKVIKNGDLGFLKNESIKVFLTKSFLFKPGEWAQNVRVSNNERYIFYLEEVGLALPGSYFIKWKMPVQNAGDLEKIILAAKFVSQK